MYKRYFLLIGLALLAVTGMWAAQVSESAARSIATQFMNERGMGAPAATRPAKAPKRNLSMATATDDAAFYVFNASRGEGFVVVSGDDRTEAVLGYSASGTFDLDNMPENVRWWFDQYEEELALLDAGAIELKSPSGGASYVSTSTVIAPMLSTTWGQNAPFYNLTPVINGKHCVTGCVATAMAQIMRYHRWPLTQTTSIPAYNREGTSLPTLSGAVFDWKAMKDYYSRSDTSTTATANVAVSRLMRWCGQAVQMKYGTSESSAFSFPEVFVDYFHYSPKARQVHRCDYSFTQWRDFILTELSAQRPVMFDGQKHSGGHCFVCDGYDGKGYYHFNWGWYGSYDGYFLLSALNPKGGGTGAATGENGFMMWERLTIGLEPNTVSTTEKNSVTTCSNVAANKSVYTRSSTDEPFVITLTASHSNEAPVARTYDLGWGVYKADGYNLYQYYTDQVANKTLNQHDTTRYTRMMNFGKGYDNGTYYLRPICRESGNDTWFPACCSGRRYIQAQVNGNTLTLYPVDTGEGGGANVSLSSYGTLKKVDRPLDVNLNVYNNGFNDNIVLYLYANDKKVGANSVTVSRGSSASVKISYVPTVSGTNNLKVTTESYDNELWTGSVNVNAVTSSSLYFSYNVPQANSNREISGNNLYLTTTIKNNYTTRYNDYIVAALNKREGDGSTFTLISTINKPVDLAGSGTITPTFDFTNLTPGRYFVNFYYYNKTSKSLGAATATYQVGVINGDINNDGAVNTGDVSALYKALLAGSTDSRYDLNGDGAVNTGDVSALYKLILGN